MSDINFNDEDFYAKYFVYSYFIPDLDILFILNGDNSRWGKCNKFDIHINTKNSLKGVLNLMGRVMGIEPTNAGTTNRSLNHWATLAIIILNILYRVKN